MQLVNLIIIPVEAHMAKLGDAITKVLGFRKTRRLSAMLPDVSLKGRLSI
jgi:hypothetical protein